MTKKRYIIIFLSAIFVNLILITNVKALKVNNYGVVANLPEFTEYTNYTIVYGTLMLNGTTYESEQFILFAFNNNYQNQTFYSRQNNTQTNSNPKGISNFNATSGPNSLNTNYIIYKLDTVNNTWVYNNERSSINVKNNSLFFVVYTKAGIKYAGSPYTTLYSSNYTITPEVTDPTFEVLMNQQIDLNGITAHRYVWEVANYSNDYYYEERIMSYTGGEWLDNWHEITFSDNLGRYVYDTYDNIRIDLRIRSKSDNTIVFDTMYVVASFTEKDIIYTDNGYVETTNGRLSKKININCTQFGSLNYYFKISLDNGVNWYTYFTNDNIDVLIYSNSTIITEVYSLIDNSNTLIFKKNYSVNFAPVGYDGYQWPITLYSSDETYRSYWTYKYLFLSNLPLQGYIIMENKDNTAIMKYYNFDLNTEITNESITGREYTYNNSTYYIYEYDITQYYNQNINVGVLIDSDFKDLGVFFVPNNTYLSYIYYEGTNNTFKEIKYVDNFDNDEVKTIINEDLFNGNVDQTISSFIEIITAPIDFIKNVVVYIYNSFNIYIKGLILTLFIYCIVGAIIKVIRR